ncbi:MAG: DUF21 domain-containing protein [Caldilineaceae bacterium]|nr:DUF21 domain-containing protein [Caldilineaceae bacterium]
MFTIVGGFALLLVGLAAAAEAALTTANRGELRSLSEAGNKRAAVIESTLRDASSLLLTTMLLKSAGIVLTGFALSSAFGGSITVLQTTLLLALSWLLIAGVQVASRALVLQRATAVSLQIAPFVSLCVQLFRPITALLRVGLKLGSDGDEVTDDTIFLTEDGLRLLINVGDEEETILDSEKEMIASILEMDVTVVREVMVPRIDMVSLNVETSLRDALETVISAGHSRIPVYEGNIDRVVGFLYAKDLLKCFRDGEENVIVREILRPAYFVPVSKKVNTLLREMQKRRVHIAMVVDEYGGTAGLVTIEDLIEEIVGEIQDEYDPEADLLVQAMGAHVYLLNSRLDVDSLAELLEIELPDQQTDTLGGLIYNLLGHVPEQGEMVMFENWQFTVTSLDGRRIDQVRAELKTSPLDQVEASDVDVDVDGADVDRKRSSLRFSVLDWS